MGTIIGSAWASGWIESSRQNPVSVSCKLAWCVLVMSLPSLNLTCCYKISMPPIFSTRFAVLILLDLRTLLLFSWEFSVILFSSIPTLNPIKHSPLPCTLHPSGIPGVVSDGLVGAVVGSWPLVRTLSAVLQSIGEVGFGVCVVSVRLAVAVGDGAHISVTSTVSVTSPVVGFFSSSRVGSSPSVVWLSVVMVMTVCSTVIFMGSLGKDLLVPCSSCFSFVWFSAISRLWVLQYSPSLYLPQLRHRLVGFLASSNHFKGWYSLKFWLTERVLFLASFRNVVHAVDQFPIRDRDVKDLQLRWMG